MYTFTIAMAEKQTEAFLSAMDSVSFKNKSWRVSEGGDCLIGSFAAQGELVQFKKLYTTLLYSN